ncbi:hypothetical protein PENTCL1PPCAC_24521 [Pristionchus entomophagus]|uniref:RRM domain-containing protein n=1 Tax=Pristionchus entomophagus TaxID=358040 RepID=A0AAV5U6E2_9BILA|nr:hypothetical protein PENTCL1PPCAC_24521 [Pristionchus entomophagus]
MMGTVNGAIGMGGGGGGMPSQMEYKPDLSMYGGRPQGGGGGGYDGGMGGAPPSAPYAAPYGREPQPQQGGYGASPVRPVQQQMQPQQQPAYGDNTPAFGGNPMGAQGGYNTNGGAYNSGGGGGGMGYGNIKKEDYAPAYSGAYPDQRVMGGGGGGAAPPFSSRVILIKNLPPDYTWQIVRDRSMTFGEVEHCELVSPGVARVRFSLNSEAERARGALAGTSVEGRPIAVDFVM